MIEGKKKRLARCARARVRYPSLPTPYTLPYTYTPFYNFRRLIGLHSIAPYSIQRLCMFSAMDCTFQTEISTATLVSQYIVQRSTQEAEMVLIYSLAANAKASSIRTISERYRKYLFRLYLP